MNKFHNLYALFFAIGIFALLFGCGPSTEITGTWANPELKNKKYTNILVTSMVNNVASRQAIETDLKLELESQGVQVTRGIDLFPPSLRDEKMGDKKSLLQAIDDNNFDALLTVTVIDSETETRYVPGTYSYAPINRFGYYGNFWGYYNYWYPQIYNAGYYAQEKIYFLETNLYDAESEILIWSAQTETVNPNSLTDFSSDFAKVITEKLRNDNLLDRSMATN